MTPFGNSFAPTFIILQMLANIQVTYMIRWNAHNPADKILRPRLPRVESQFRFVEASRDGFAVSNFSADAVRQLMAEQVGSAGKSK